LPFSSSATTTGYTIAHNRREQLSYGEVRVARDSTSQPVNAMIFQEQSLFPWMTVRDNVAYGLRMRGVPKPVWALTVDGSPTASTRRWSWAIGCSS
jgi:ABC-type taurine transport system ATPase subunit